MRFYPNPRQWTVIWTVTVLTLGIWLLSAPWEDLAIPSVAQQRVEEGARRQAEGRRRPLSLGDARARTRAREVRELVWTRVIVAVIVAGGLLVWQFGASQRKT